MRNDYHATVIDDDDDILADDPYPLGVPERVRIEADARMERLINETMGETPRYVIDCSRLVGEDYYHAVRAAGDFLDGTHCDADTRDSLVIHLDSLWHEQGKRLRRVEVTWNNELGWHVLQWYVTQRHTTMEP